MENVEILGFQFEPIKELQPDSSSGESWETCSLADSERSTTRRSEASVDIGACVSTVVKSNNKGVLVLS